MRWLLTILVWVGFFITGVVCLADDGQEISTTSIQMDPKVYKDSDNSLDGFSLGFIENQGQWEDSVKYATHKEGLCAFFNKGSFTLNFTQVKEKAQFNTRIVRLVFEGVSESVSLKGQNKQSGMYNFFIGSDPEKWRSRVAGYRHLIYQDLYEGVDLRIKEDDGGLAYDLLLSEDADLRKVVLRVEGAIYLEIADHGSLLIHTGSGIICLKQAQCYYKLSSKDRSPFDIKYRLIDNNHYGFEAPSHTKKTASVIDPHLIDCATKSKSYPKPGLLYSTYLGGSEQDNGGDIVISQSGERTVTGWTLSFDFPTTTGAYDPTFNDSDLIYSDAVVTRFNAEGSDLIFSTFLGGSQFDFGFKLLMDDNGDVIVGGKTSSSDFPITHGQPVQGSFDAFVCRLDSTGSMLIESRALGGAMEDIANGMIIDQRGRIIITGTTASRDFPTTPHAFDTTYNDSKPLLDGFLSVLTPDLSQVLYSTFIGGNNFDLPSDLSFDDTGALVVIGKTYSQDFPVTDNAFQLFFNGIVDGFVTIWNPEGKGREDLLYSTFIGGSGYDYLYGIVTGESNELYMVGGTTSNNFPVTKGAFDETYMGSHLKGIVVSASQDSLINGQLLYASYLGGSDYDFVTSVVLEPSGSVVVAGNTLSLDYPTTKGCFQPDYQGDHFDIFISRLALKGQGARDLLYSTYFGGTSSDKIISLFLEEQGLITFMGDTLSLDFPITDDAFDTSLNSEYSDIYVTRFLLP